MIAGTTYTTNQATHDTGGALVLDLIVILALVVVAGIMSGLTLGLLSLDTMNLEIIISAGDPQDAKNAKKILPLVKRHHLLLVTLLLANAAAMEALPIFLDKMVPTWAAIVLSVTLVLLFGEIIPQALCSRFGLSIGATLAYFVWAVMGLLFIIAWPISKVLDAILGAQHPTYFKKRGELKELITHHGNENVEHGILTMDETTIMKGALDMKDKTAMDVMTPLEKVFMLRVDQKLDQDVVQQIAESGRSRIPIYRETRDHIIGVLLVKYLLSRLLTPYTDTVIDDLVLRKLPTVSGSLSLYDLLNQFQTGKSHMAVVVSPADHMTVLGIVTLEDVIEELIQEEIYDEADISVQQKQQQKALRKSGNSLSSPYLNNNHLSSPSLSPPPLPSGDASVSPPQHEQWKGKSSLNSPKSGLS